MRWLLAIGVILMGVLLWGMYAQAKWSPVPPAYNPFAPLAIKDPITWMTRWKLARLEGDADRCWETLAQEQNDRSELNIVAQKPLELGQCRLERAARVFETGVRFNASFLASCPLAVRWLMFERHRLQPIAERTLGSPVRQVVHYGSFACRNVYNRPEGRRSEHATADAFDLAGVVLDDGRRLTLEREWDDGGERGLFWHQAFDGACDVFGTVLGPEYNQAHRNHFHMGLRRYGFCR
ncbi:extensin-like domain-containing protein [Larsenimonas suaedae]|uniref:Extensin family protein n=1 Tax=Larsenimonas suaedae TaxID=1851019 RepID=A0ABU1GWU4_9GAMM|nr:extensin family protein [Larsenimonas suaedae]MCM2973079.1 extensin family protein [Larsenimonas suaedae]MDR5896516.1 extensin family protein [Larsenimonas suaedae]